MSAPFRVNKFVRKFFIKLNIFKNVRQCVKLSSRKYKEITLALFILCIKVFSYFRKKISTRRLPHSEWAARIFTQFHWTRSGSHCCRGTMRSVSLNSRTWPEIISSRYHVRFMPGNLVLPLLLRLSRGFENVYRGSTRKYPILGSHFPFIYRSSPWPVTLWRIS